MTLQDYLFLSLPPQTAAYLALVTGSQLSVVVTDTLDAYGVTDEVDATDLMKLHAIGKFLLWQRNVEYLLTNKFAPGNAQIGSEYSAHIDEAIKIRNFYQSQAEQYIETEYPEIEVGTLHYANDPYQFPRESDIQGL